MGRQGKELCGLEQVTRNSTHSCCWPQQRRVVLRSEMRIRLVGKQEKWAQWVFTQRGLDKILGADGCLLGKQEEETGSC